MKTIFKIILLVSIGWLQLNATIQKVNESYVIVQTAGDTYMGNELDQTYSLNPFLIGAGESIIILDQGGSNTIELVAGLTITSSIVASNEIVLHFNNGASVDIREANTFTFDVGANSVANIIGTKQNFVTFVTSTLGLDRVPTQGQPVVNGGAVDAIVAGGGTPDATEADGKLRGKVVDLSGKPISGVRINVDRKEKITDTNGNFSFDNLSISERSVLLASHQDYLANSRVVSVNDSVEARLTIVLAKADIRRTFASNSGVTVSENDGTSITLSPNIYVDAEGNRYDGDVKLSLNYYPITTRNGQDLFPGNFDALNQNNNRGTLESYGFVIIDLKDNRGNQLNINGRATISLPADGSLGRPLATLPLWYYDEERGIWIEDGEANYNESTGRYEGEITRIATYNLDVFSNPANLKVCVEDKRGVKVSNAYVQLENETMTWNAHVGPTSEDGYINILGVLGETNLNISAYTFDGKYGAYSNNPINLASGESTELDRCIVIDDGNSSLTGVVEEVGTDRKLDNVNVALKLNNQVIFETKTDINGTYSFDKLSKGLLYSLEYTKERYQSRFYNNIEVEENQLKYLEVVKLTQNSAIAVGTVSGIITNALDGVGVENATLKIREGTNNKNGVIVTQSRTSSSGEYSIVLSPNTYTVEVIKDGFIVSYFTVTSISSETTSNQNFSISPLVTQGDMRIVLTWGASPSDLDSHLVRKTDGSSDYHVYYLSRTGIDSNLDHDDTTSYGPETVTINNPNADSVYTYYVHNYSGGNGLKSSGAKVNVSFNNVQRTFNVPNEDGLYWKVFEIVDNVIIPCSSNCVQGSVNSDIVRRVITVNPESELFMNLPQK